MQHSPEEKKVAVIPGKGVTVEDLSESLKSKTKRNKTKKQKKKKRR